MNACLAGAAPCGLVGTVSAFPQPTVELQIFQCMVWQHPSQPQLLVVLSANLVDIAGRL